LKIKKRLMKKHIAPMLLCIPLALALPARATDIIAHRGASHDAPENTLAAEKLAWEQNADAVETDIYLTKDGKILAMHDKTARRTTGRNATIASMTFDEARKLDAGKWKDSKYAGEKLPTLAEQLALIPAGKRMFVEIKTGPEIVPAFAGCLARCGAGRHNVTVISFNYDSLVAVRKQLPGLATLYLMGYKSPDAIKPGAKPQPSIDEVIAQARTAGFTGLSLQGTWPLTPADVQKIKKAGLQLHVWTIDDPAKARQWIELGAQSITTNRPGWLRAQLKL
jgi:glycerophosphoryl diester phosphodiesterase